MLKLIRDLLTERDGVSWCIGRFVGAAASVEMMVKFAGAIQPDFQNFGVGIAAVVASVAAKNFSERD